MFADNTVTVQRIFSLLREKGTGVVKVNKMLSQPDFGNLWNTNCNSSPTAEEISNTCFTETHRPINSDIPGELLNFIPATDPLSYPNCLRNLLGNSAPPVLTALGNLNLLSNRTLGFSGSRKSSPKGLQIAAECALVSARQGVTTVSGYASGIDCMIHRATLQAGGNTIMVLPEGINSFRIKKELQSVWDWNRILVISEFLPEAPWTISRAMTRNNTILALSQALVIVEAKDHGGSIDAGRKALEKKKPLLVADYRQEHETNRGNRILLNLGATPLRRNPRTSLPNLPLPLIS